MSLPPSDTMISRLTENDIRVLHQVYKNTGGILRKDLGAEEFMHPASLHNALTHLERHQAIKIEKVKGKGGSPHRIKVTPYGRGIIKAILSGEKQHG